MAQGYTTPAIIPLPLTVSNGGTGVVSNTSYAVLCGGTSSTNPIQSVASVGTAGQVLTSNGAGALPTFQGTAVLQQVRSSNTTYSTITGTIPQDDTIPQITEGTEVLSITITPKSASSVLFFQVVVPGAVSAGFVAACCLFKSGTSNALAVTNMSSGSETHYTWSLNYSQTSGDTTSQTYSVRIGKQSGNCFLNGGSGGRYFGGAMVAYITITEYAS